MNRSRKVFNQGLAALLVLMLVMPFTAMADSGKKKTSRSKQRAAKTTAPATVPDKQDAETPDKGETKSDAKSETATKPSANDETAAPIVAVKQQTSEQTPTQTTQTPTQTPAQDQ